ncbi:hypothetical protein [Synechocystis sp. PCC 7339]|uniref:hypothetical protein n=1 Tax=Synechocystis sp. PCC 7339 TaxID=2782213 RepID=UPI0021075951|nr:hypothetical protein [Synechocystis sp. PCC 7339]
MLKVLHINQSDIAGGVASLSMAINGDRLLWARARLKEANREEKQMATTADEVWQLLGELIASQKETDRRIQETERLLKEQIQKTDEQIRAVNKELGELGNRLGEFVEWQVARRR